MSAPAIGFLSDYGLRDEFVGVCHGVIAGRCPQARVIDITHGVPARDVRTGALALAAALPYLPPGVALAVVDPGVGGRRRALALRTRERGRLLVGPDNGLLMPAAELFGGVQDAVEVSSSRVRLEPVSSTFHGRDIFAPVAAALAAGEPLESLGSAFAPAELTRLQLPHAQRRGDALAAHALRVDGFGNVSLDASFAQLEELGFAWGASQALSVSARGLRHEGRLARTFAEGAEGELLLLEDSQRMLALALNGGSAAQLLGVRGAAEELLIGPR